MLVAFHSGCWLHAPHEGASVDEAGKQRLKRNIGEGEMIKCFVVGCERSGTTLLSVLLDRHSELAVPPETGFYTELAPVIASPSLHELETALAHWRRLPELGLEPKEVTDACEGDFRPSAVFRALLMLYASKRGKPHCGEKTPIHCGFVPRILTDFPEAIVIHILRDGRDVVASLLEAPWWTKGIEAAADRWLHSVRTLELFAPAFPGQFMVVHYERLVQAPEATLKEVMAPLKLEFQGTQLNPAKLSAVVLERSLAWKGRALAAVDGARAGRWRDRLTEEQSAFLAKRLSPQLRRMGYA